MKFALGTEIPEGSIDRCFDLIKSNNIKSIEGIALEVFYSSLKEEIASFLHSKSFCRDFSGENTDAFIFVDCNLDKFEQISEKILVSTALFNVVNSCFFEQSIEPRTKAPFTLYKSTADNKEKMQQSGIRFYSPDEKLGFHNDVLYKGKKYIIPRYISLMNVFLGYNSPGLFYFLDKRSWADIDEFLEEGKGRRFKFRPTPVVYSSTLENVAALEEWSSVPVVWKNSTGEPFVFCNGELMDDEGDDFIARLKKSLLENDNRVGSNQRPFRIMLFRNDIGFHSRDIMKEQFVFQGATRLMLRSMSRQGIEIPD